ncbi:MAG: transcriptional repressor LexA [Ignavibacteria bacterium]|nr:transcriptional repressor LexA [Ignavibacteria bacterium]
MSEQLTERQREILEFIRQFIDETGYPPTLREISRQFGMSSTFGVQRHLDALKKKGYLSKDSFTSRGLSLVKSESAAEAVPFSQIPVVGRVAAGLPITAIENIEGNLLVDNNFLKRRDNHFALRVKGDSMIDDGIFDGDYVIVAPSTDAREGEIVVARLQDEVTVKRFSQKQGQIQLLPANKHFSPIIVNNLEIFTIIGKVVGVMRWLP